MKPEDENLTIEQFSDLNRQFYSSDPAAYFKRRLHLLLFAAGASDQLHQIFADGVRYEKIIAKLDPPKDMDADRREREAFLATDAEVLLHHSSEALLRLYFAHANHPSCPWLECARLRNFTEFKKQVEKFATMRLDRQTIADMFLGQAIDESAADVVAPVEQLLKMLARRLLDDKNLYNASKHGLAVIAGKSRINVSSDSGAESFGSYGLSLSFLETVGEKADRKWNQTTRWVSIKQAMWLTMLAITEMASLWAVAKYRYRGDQPEGVEVIKQEALDDAISGEFANSQPISRFSVRLAYHQPGDQSGSTKD